MRVGSLVYATNQGLGILAKSFYDNEVVDEVLMISHQHHVNHHEWYKGCGTVHRPLHTQDRYNRILNFCRSCDVMLFFETPFIWELIRDLKDHYTKTVLMTMYECTPSTLPYIPDVFLCPSLLDYQVFSKLYKNVYYTPVPVQVPWRKRTEAKVFVHNAGHGGLKGRNGTAELLEALQYVQSPIWLILRSQTGLLDLADFTIPKHVVVTTMTGDIPYEDLYSMGDVFVFPEKFNGLSLPLQESFASGMVVMTTDRYPNNTYLPKGPLIPVETTRPNRIGSAYLEFQEAIINPKSIAECIDKIYGIDINDLSEQGRKYAEQMSWSALKSLYTTTLTRLMNDELNGGLLV